MARSLVLWLANPDHHPSLFSPALNKPPDLDFYCGSGEYRSPFCFNWRPAADDFALDPFGVWLNAGPTGNMAIILSSSRSE